MNAGFFSITKPVSKSTENTLNHDVYTRLAFIGEEEIYEFQLYTHTYFFSGGEDFPKKHDNIDEKPTGKTFNTKPSMFVVFTADILFMATGELVWNLKKYQLTYAMCEDHRHVNNIVFSSIVERVSDVQNKPLSKQNWQFHHTRNVSMPSSGTADETSSTADSGENRLTFLVLFVLLLRFHFS